MTELISRLDICVSSKFIFSSSYSVFITLLVLMVILSSLSDRHSTISASATMFLLCLGLGLWKSPWAAMTIFAVPGALPELPMDVAGLAGWVVRVPGSSGLGPCLPPPEAPPPLLLFPRFPHGLQPLLVEETAATSSPSTDLIVRLATTEVEAAFDAHTLSAWSKTCSTVSVLNSWSAMVFLTA